ncbi:MAG: TonB-dependent receptor, partial [Porticoccaceae bacterium]|nr:TonB-dependent receptor [Porticoccaceae bacterium]
MNNTSFRTVSALAIAIATASSGAYAAQLEEIIVTAQKRAESLQDVPMSVTAIGGDKIADAGLNSLSELSAYVPNLTVAENAVNTIIAMRGVGIGANQSFEQSVGIYVDGVHYGKSRQVRTGLFDLQQVEALRGPQGTLFGKNTLAGAINVTSATPQVGQESGGKVTVNKESFGGTAIEGHVTGSLSDTIALRFAYKTRENDGHLDNSFAGTSLSSMPTTDESMWRLSATWEASDNTVVELKHSESKYERLGMNAVITQFSPLANIASSNALMYGTMGAIYPALGQLVAAGTKDSYRDAISVGGCALEAAVGMSSEICSNGGERPEGTNTETADSSLNIEIELTNGYTLTSVTGKGSYEYQDGIDADFLPVRFIGRSDISDYDHTSQEFRLTSPSEDRFSFVLGAYYDKQEQEIDRNVTVDGTFGIPHIMPAIIGTDTFLGFSPAQVAGVNALYGLTGTPYAFVPGVEGSTKFQQVGRISNWKQDTDSWAVFFQGSYDITDELAITAGVRYTEEDKSVHADMDLTTNTTGLATPNAHPLLGALMGASFASYAHNFNEDRSTDAVMPSVNLEWSQSDDNMFYIAYSEGFKSGGFNAVDDQDPAFTAAGVQPTVPGLGFEYDDETSSSFEIGGKHTLLDGAMNLNWALFDSEYKDQQVSTFVGLGFVVTNAASTDVKGLELDLTWQATDNLQLGASVA